MSANCFAYQGRLLRLLIIGCVCQAPTWVAAVESMPDAGSLLRSMQLTPEKNESNPDIQNLISLEIAEENPPDTFEIFKLVISGNTLFPTEQLHRLVADLEGKSLTFRNSIS